MNVSVVSVVDTLTGLAQNLALLLSLTLLYSVIRPYLPRVPRPLRQVAAGVLFALIAIAAMHTPFIIAPGVIADARVIPVLLAGPFGGPAAALPAGLFLPFGTLVLGMLLVHESRRHDERERLALTQFAIEHATEALFWIDAEGHIVNVNAAAAGLTGYARDELLTKRV